MNATEKKVKTSTQKKTNTKKTVKAAVKKKVNSKTKNKEKQLAEELSAFKDKYLRLSAEFDNYRRRTIKEKAELSKTAGEDIIINMLTILDDFERAIQNISKAKDLKAVLEGIELIYNKFKDILSRKGLKVIEAKEKEFNVDMHEAITKIPAPNKKLKGKVVDVIEKGYSLNEKIIRYPKVVVGE